MSYQKYSMPLGGYGAGAGKGYSGALTPGGSPQFAPASEQKPEAFTELSAIFDGVGNYHTNHFVGYFNPPQGLKLKVKELTQLFYENFCTIFSANNIASARPGDPLKFMGLDTVRFRIGGNLGDDFDKATGLVHHDWVSMQMEKPAGETFYGTTLKREWMEDFELKTLSEAVGRYETKFALGAIWINQHHFLAGRRSWRVGHNDDLDAFYVETATFERNSNIIYQGAEWGGRLRDDVKKLWAHLIVNFAAAARVKLLHNYLPPGYAFVDEVGDVAYKADEHESGVNALNASWFAEVLKRHPGLIKGL